MRAVLNLGHEAFSRKEKMCDSDTLSVKNNKAMDAQQTALYERIQLFSPDQPDALFPFSQRLRKETGWSLETVHQAIKEYKRFVFLAIVAEHFVVPSYPVDQVWHLHLSYTRSYWEEFCPQILQAPLHHEPAQGGASEQQKYEQEYRNTLESYRHFFQQEPPSEIWPAPEVYFSSRSFPGPVHPLQDWMLSNGHLSIGIVVSSVLLFVLILVGFCIGRFGENINLLEVTPFFILVVLLGFGAIQFLAGVLDTIQNPSRPPRCGCGG